jgi:hypothetical protein
MRTLVDLAEPTPRSNNMDFFKHWSAEGTSVDVDEIIDHWRRQNRQRLGDVPAEVLDPEPAAPDAAESPRRPPMPVPGQAPANRPSPVPRRQPAFQAGGIASRRPGR